MHCKYFKSYRFLTHIFLVLYGFNLIQLIQLFLLSVSESEVICLACEAGKENRERDFTKNFYITY
jgi:hypothetical protein